MKKSQKIYIVYIYCDYRKDVDIQFLRAFKSESDAVEFAKKYENDKKSMDTKYMSIRGSIYDAELFYPGDDNDKLEDMTDEIYE